MGRIARLALVMLALASCGGQVDGGSREPDVRESSPAEANEGASDSESSSPGSDNPDADTELGTCKLGRRESYAEPCAWVAEGRCYATREAACNCACPRSRNSQCVSGFEAGPDGHVWLACK